MLSSTTEPMDIIPLTIMDITPIFLVARGVMLMLELRLMPMLMLSSTTEPMDIILLTIMDITPIFLVARGVMLMLELLLMPMLSSTTEPMATIPLTIMDTIPCWDVKHWANMFLNPMPSFSYTRAKNVSREPRPMDNKKNEDCSNQKEKF